MSKFTNLIGTKQIADNAITEVELAVALQTKVAQITTNQTDIANIVASKGAANGIATLGADGKLPASQIPAIAVSDFLGEVADEASMLALTGQRGDWAVRTDESKTYMLAGDDASVLANWKEIVSPSDGVTALRNTSGSQTGLNGVVTLADVAFSGAANDVSYTDADYAATDVAGALTEVMGKAKTNESNLSSLTTTVDGKVGLTGIHPYVELTGDINGTNADFTSPVDLAGAKVNAYLGGQLVRPADFSISGNVVTFTATPDYEYQRPALMVMKAA
ncbi:MAG: hypothetical protein R3F02_18765 [Thiolinea sp.]